MFSTATAGVPSSYGLTSTSLYTLSSYYPSQSACQTNTVGATSLWAMQKYTFPGYQFASTTTCNAPTYSGANYAPPLSYGTVCATATSPTTSNFALIQVFSDSQCATPATDASAYQLNTCFATGATTS